MKRVWCFSVCLIFLLADDALAEIYSWVDEHGVKHYSNQSKDMDRSTELVVTSKLNSMDKFKQKRRRGQAVNQPKVKNKITDERQTQDRKKACKDIKEQQRALKVKMKSGYTLKKANALKMKKRNLSQQYWEFCS